MKEETTAQQSDHPAEENSGRGEAVGQTAEALLAGPAPGLRQYPLTAMAVAFGGGMLCGWLIARKLKTRLSASSEERQQMTREDEANQSALSGWEAEGGAALAAKMEGGEDEGTG